ncbi:hypothetical protein DFQ26_009541 [Actinomortierella ambigua]|nr:hypothetical protein DFQ26_009541 [Actinomortierella ambigua]
MSQNVIPEDDVGLTAIDYDDDSDLDFDFELDGPDAVDPAQVVVDQYQQLKHRINRAFLEARQVERDFWHRKIWHTETTHRDYTPSGTQQRWFLAMEHMPSDDAYYALNASLPDSPEVSPEVSPEEFSARFPLRNHRATQGDRPETPEQSTNNTLVLIANFQDVTSGPNTLYLRVKQVIAEEKAARFLVRIVVLYVHTGISEIFYTRFIKNVDGITGWHYLKAEDQFGVRPHRGVAQVNIRIMQDKGYNTGHCGQLWIRSLELVPFGEHPSHLADPVVHPPSDADFMLSTRASPTSHSGNGGNQGHPGGEGDQDGVDDGVVTRLVTSKNGEFLAALVVFSQRVEVKVWRTDDVNSMDRRTPDVQAYTDMHLPNADKIPLELAISATGEHIAVFQVPEVGEWQETDQTPKSSFEVCIFRNLNASWHTAIHDFDLSVNNPQVDIGDEVGVPLVTFAARPIVVPYLDHMKGLPSNIKGSVGYAAFVGKSTSGIPSLPERFVFCNGLYFDVFELKGDMLVHRNSIPLVNMSSSLQRTEACDLMVRSITNNMFLWVEENGQYCSTWDLSSGSAIGRIEITGLQVGGLLRVRAIRFAYSQSIIAIVGDDNSITTVDAITGVTISCRLFSGRIIENIVFASPQSDFLLVMFRSVDECEQSVLVLDPLRLDVEGQVKGIPPLSRSTVFVNFGHRQWPELGVVCRPDGQDIRFYNCRMLRPSHGGRRANVEQPPEDCRFELRTREPLMRLGQETCKRQVEIWKRADPTDPASHNSCVFSFIPEPWELHSPANGMILPTGDRFIVWASWTVQLWSLPTPREPQCKLLFYWSSTNDSFRNCGSFGKSPTEVILEYYRQFDLATCHQLIGEKRFQVNVGFSNMRAARDRHDDLLYGQQYNRADFYSSGRRIITLPIPDDSLQLVDSLIVTEQCVKSILLLALTHLIVSLESNPTAQDGSYRDHASAIIDFVNTHINHSVKLPNPEAENNPVDRTILTHLLAIQRVSELTSKFIASLFENIDCIWIPRNNVEIAFIAKAFEYESFRAILAYCSRKACTSCPAFVTPLERLFRVLTNKYPELLKDFLRKTSYIPAQQVDFNETCITFTRFEGVTARHLIVLTDHQTPVFMLRLREQSSCDIENRVTKFKEIAKPTAIPIANSWRVYTVPFPSLLILGHESRFHLLARENYFDSPSQMAILSYKMHSSEQVDSPEALEDLYLGDVWFRLIIVDIVLGCGLLLFALMQRSHGPVLRFPL